MAKSDQSEKRVEVYHADLLQKVSGVFDENLKVLEKELSVSVRVEDRELVVKGAEGDASCAADVLATVLKIAEDGGNPDKGQVSYLVSLAREGKSAADAARSFSDTIAVTSHGKPIKCKTVGQRRYIDAIERSSITFGIGPAGVGTTYLAVCLAVRELKQRKVERIILTRPAVEAGEKLGFLPGDLQEKVDPYLRPLYDALGEMLGSDTYAKYVERGAIEVAPLAYMRGRTLTNAFVILDEAQNATREQVKMFLTRLGEGSKMVVNGDVTQMDLPDGAKSGLSHAANLLKGIEGISAVYMDDGDVVRNPLVAQIVRAYDREAEDGGRK